MKRRRTLTAAGLALALFVVGAGAWLGVWLAGHVSASFDPQPEVILSDYTAGVNADVTTNFNIPSGDVNFDAIATYTPPDWWVAGDADIPDGTQVGTLDSAATLGLAIGSGTCNIALNPSFTLYECTTEGAAFMSTGDLLAGTWNGYDPTCLGQGIGERQVCEYPDLLDVLFPVRPRARYCGHTMVTAGVESAINVLVFEPGTDLGNGIHHDPAWGYPAVTVLNDTGVPGEPVPSALADFCTPLISNNTIFGEADGLAVRTNPQYGGTHVFRTWARGLPDADGDGLENGLDTCPYVQNLGDPRVPGSVGDEDQDGLDDACDPNTSSPPGDTDEDDDAYHNRADNCPIVANGIIGDVIQGDNNQLDSDGDGIGEVCDQNPAMVDGTYPEALIEHEIEIEGPQPTPTLPPTATATPTPTPGPTNFDPSFSADLSSYAAGENGVDIYTDFSVPGPDYNFDAAITFTPPDWTVFADVAVPDGAYVGHVFSTSTLGLINGPCNSALPVSFDLMEATTDTSQTVTFDDQFQDADGNTLPDGVDQYPDFLTRMFPGLTPRSRYFGQASVAGSAVSLNFALFEPGTLGFDPSLGYPSVTVLNNNGDPGAVLAPSPITDFCTPLSTSMSTFGTSGDNPATATDEGGYGVRANPGAGTYSFWMYARSLRDADSDGIENGLDTCPFVVNVGSPRVAGSGDQDNDGIDDACDPTPTETKVDEDDDAYTNRGDNCPLVANGFAPDNQGDADMDGIGDACDPSPGSPSGIAIERMLEDQVTIDGETCSPVIPGTYYGTVTLGGLPAPDGTVIRSSIGGMEWGTATTSGGYYALDVPQWLPTQPPCFEGGLVEFAVDGAQCQPAVLWSSGGHPTNLECGDLPGVTVRVDDGVSVEALGVPDPGLGAYTLDVTYNPAAFTPVSCDSNPNDDFDTALCNLAYTPDTVRASALRASPGLEGDVPLANVAFQTAGPVCPADLVVSVPTLADSDGSDIWRIVDHKWWVGDADRDFDKDAVDALFCLQYVVGMRNGTDSCPMPSGQLYLPAADAGCDADVDAVDCLFILQHVVGFRPELCPSGLATPTPTPNP